MKAGYTPGGGKCYIAHRSYDKKGGGKKGYGKGKTGFANGKGKKGVAGAHHLDYGGRPADHPLSPDADDEAAAW